VAAPAAAADAAGHWKGAIEIPATPLAIDVDLAAGADGPWSGDITIPAQMARDLPLADIRVEGAAVGFKIADIPGDPTFAGRLSEDGQTLSGTFTQGAQSFPFSLARAEAPAEGAKQALDGFAELAEAARAAREVPGLAMAIVQGGEVVFARGFGRRDVEANLPVTPDTLFAIGSCTKAFTTFVLGTLVDEGKLEWDQPVREYLPAFQMHDPVATEQLTPRDLVTHRSGLPRHDLLWYNNQGLARAELVRRLRYLTPSQPLRAKFQYNNLMFLTAGFLIEQVTGKSWEQAVRQRIFEPLGMTGSNFSVEESQRAADFAQPYEEREDEVVKIPFRPIGNMGPAGSINSSVADLAKWVKLHLSGGRVGERRLIGATTLADIHSPHMPTGSQPERAEFGYGSYGLGWLVDSYRGHHRVTHGHGGAIDGFSALVTLFPQEGLGMVVLANKSGAGLNEILVRHAADRLLGLDPINWNAEDLAKTALGEKAEAEAKGRKETVRRPGTRPAHALDEYAGEYEHPGYGTLSVVRQGEALALSFNRIETPLEHWHYEVWNAAKGAADPALEDLKFRFEGDVLGNVARLAAQFEPAVDEIIFAKKPDARLLDPAYLGRFVGTYQLAAQVLTVSLQGDTLTLSLPGAPLLHLVPGLGETFTFKEVSIVSARFESDEAGKVTAMMVSQPDGVYRAERKP
jgi:CubicO group peptidase (beta-lactamase class C family)